MSLSQRHFYGDDDEHVSHTQFNHESIVNSIKVVTPTEPLANCACDIPYEEVNHGMKMQMWFQMIMQHD